MSKYLLASAAESLFWLARYIERAENLARILHVNSTFSRDSEGAQDWSAVLGLNDDEERFRREHGAPSPQAVMRFYVIDRANPTSIISAVDGARANALAVRSLISSEMWAQLNVFRNWLSGLDDGALVPSDAMRLLTRIKNNCQEHTGITEGTFYRDDGWCFYWLGRYLERADQTTRLLDIKYHLILPTPQSIGSSSDVAQWYALLRSAAGYHAFRRTGLGEATPGRVASFLLLDPSFPRSVVLCTKQIKDLLEQLSDINAGGKEEALLMNWESGLDRVSIAEILEGGLHEFLEKLQLNLITLSTDLSKRYFDR